MINAASRSCDVTIRPDAGAWAALLGRPPSDPEKVAFRRQLGLPDGTPIIMTGHQAEFWHPGILAKYLAAAAAARTLGGRPAWIVVDQDANDPSRILYPYRRTDGHLGLAAWELTGAAEPDVPTCARGPMSPGDPPLGAHPPVVPSVAEGLRRIGDALRPHADAPSAAAQIVAATASLLTGLLAPAVTIFASRLSETDLFARIVRTMRDDPVVCVRAYNDGVRAHPRVGVKPLRIGAGRTELPLWRLDGGHRRPVYSEELGGIPLRMLAPRALLMTALLRMAACELLVHGIGGGGPAGENSTRAGAAGYDAVTESWVSRWLGEELAPAVVVTATCRLPIEAEAPPTPTETARAVWEAHHARHWPALLGDDAAGAEKMRLVQRIRTMREKGEDPSTEFTRLHGLLARVRNDRAAQLDALRRRAELMEYRLVDAEILSERTWACALYPHGILRSLKDQIDAAFARGAARDRSPSSRPT